jgi:hypothetical protein
MEEAMSRNRETGAELLQQAITAELEVLKTVVIGLDGNVAECVEPTPDHFPCRNGI